MNINDQWKKMSEETGNELPGLFDMSSIKSSISKDPLQVLKKNILINTVWAAVIAAGYLFILLHYFFYWQLSLCMGSMFLFTLAGVAQNINLYRSIGLSAAGNSVLEEMLRHYTNIRQWIKNQEIAMIFIYPVAAAGGFMLGLLLFSGKPLAVLMQRPTIIISLVVLVILLVPAGYFLGKYLNRKAFGQYCDQLKGNIDALKAER
ncbi:MAG: hypothetical protein QM791_14085 [Ferruginibacter sp.]